MSNVTINVTGLNDVKAAIKRYGDSLVSEIVDITGMVQARVVEDAKMNHPYQDRTTHLTQSIQIGPVSVDDKGIEGVVEARQPYASYVEFGTSRARAFPFLVPALLNNIPTFRASVKAAINRAKAK